MMTKVWPMILSMCVQSLCGREMLSSIRDRICVCVVLVVVLMVPVGVVVLMVAMGIVVLVGVLFIGALKVDCS